MQSSAEPTWTLEGTDVALTEFDAIARRGASMLEPPQTGDLALAWLEALWHQATHGTVRSPSEIIGQPQFPADKLRMPVQLRGRIDRVFQSSSALCRKFESKALQAEFEEKQRNDPKNWSPLRHSFEAFKAIKEIHATPPERIPESLIRETIARQYGIKPEDVTKQQIRFEISSLLRTYPHVEVIPSEAIPIESPQHQQTTEPTLNTPKETIGGQIQRLREECRWSAEKLTEMTNLDLRTVTRHLSGETTPQLRNLSAYERVFSKRLNRRVVIEKMP
jgi:hypothetical protein